MGKIEPVAWALDCQTMGGDTTQKLSWNRSGFGVCTRLQGDNHETPLFTREALEAAVEGTIWVMAQRAIAQGKDAGFICGISLDDVLTQIQIIQGETK